MRSKEIVKRMHQKTPSKKFSKKIRHENSPKKLVIKIRQKICQTIRQKSKNVGHNVSVNDPHFVWKSPFLEGALVRKVDGNLKNCAG